MVSLDLSGPPADPLSDRLHVTEVHPMKRIFKPDLAPLAVLFGGVAGFLLRLWTLGSGPDEQGLYEPMLIEEPLSELELLQHPTVAALKGDIVHISPTYKHVLSHQIIEARFVKIHLTQENDLLQTMQKISDTELNNYPVSRLIERYRATQAPPL